MHLTPYVSPMYLPGKLVAGESERASYYNLNSEATYADLTREEALRWDVLPWAGEAPAARSAA